MIRALPPAFRTERLLAQRLGERHLDDLDSLYAEPAVRDWLGGATRDELNEWLAATVKPHWERHGFGLFALYEKALKEPGRPDDRGTTSPPQLAPRQRPFVGYAGLVLAAEDVRAVLGEPKALELLFALMPDQWGRGYASEIVRVLTGLALGSLDWESVIACVSPGNERARHVLGGCAFAVEGEIVHEGLTRTLYRRRRGRT